MWLMWKRNLQVVAVARYCAFAVGSLFFLSMNIARAEIAYPQFAAPGYVPTPNCAECATLANAPGMPEIKLPFEKNLYETKNGFLYPASATRYLAAPSAPLPT
ncbi:MAG TPA: hypothetical protein PLH57_06530, partial [Oligoflexia bacterium]|nr:hypothetical protein [Oligoflexia bacterium]